MGFSATVEKVFLLDEFTLFDDAGHQLEPPTTLTVLFVGYIMSSADDLY